MDQITEAIYAMLLSGQAVFGTPVTSNAVVHANGDVAAFDVTGTVLITSIYGAVAAPPAGAVIISVGHNPTFPASTTVEWCVGADINGTGVGDLITMNYVAGTLTTVTNGVSGRYYIVANAGQIFIRGTAIQGASIWTVSYAPLTTGAAITAV